MAYTNRKQVRSEFSSNHPLYEMALDDALKTWPRELQTENAGILIVHQDEPLLTWDIMKEFNLSDSTNINMNSANSFYVADHYVIHMNFKLMQSYAHHLAGTHPLIRRNENSYGMQSYFVAKEKTRLDTNNKLDTIITRLGCVYRIGKSKLSAESQIALTYFAPIFCQFCCNNNGKTPVIPTEEAWHPLDLVQKYFDGYRVDPFDRTLLGPKDY